MSKKRFFWLSITLIWVLASIVFTNRINKPYSSNGSVITIDNSKKIVYKVVYAPLRLVDVHSFVDINSKNNMCNQYIKQGAISLQYEYEGKRYTVDKYGNFDIDTKFKYRAPIKVILEAKKDVGKCNFFIFVYPGKLNMLLIGIIFFWLPIYLVFINIILPIVKYFTRSKQ